MKPFAPLLAAAVLALSLLCHGCAAPGPDLQAAGLVRVEPMSSGGVRLSGVQVYQDDQSLVVDGSLRRPAVHRAASFAHIDVAVLAPDGTVLTHKSFPHAWLNCPRDSLFRTRLPIVPPPGATVRVFFHDDQEAPPSGHSPQQWDALLNLAQRP